MPAQNIESINDYLLNLQDSISTMVKNLDPGIGFQEDNWKRSEGGGGRTRAIHGGQVFEKAGINFSHIWGNRLPESATLKRPDLSDAKFSAVGLSVIIHPLNPFIPTCHANLRYFNAKNKQGKDIWWFGGGFDLTPYYPFVDDCVHWHSTAKKACDPFGKNVYQNYKEAADRYFYIKHRKEPRGIGGIFFDDLNDWGFDTCFNFLRSVGDHFLEAYFPIVNRRRVLPFTEKHREFQCYRRGRYVEFNLVYDRGTLFGLQSDGKMESILISLPPQVSWQYNWLPSEGSPEAELYEKFLPARDWINYS